MVAVKHRTNSGELRGVRCANARGIGAVHLLASVVVVRGSRDIAVVVTEAALVLTLHEQGVVRSWMDVCHHRTLVGVMGERRTAPLGRAVATRHLEKKEGRGERK